MRIKEVRLLPRSGCALVFVAWGTGVHIGLQGDAGTTRGADEVVAIRRSDFFLHVLRRLPEGDHELVLAQLLDGDAQRVLGTGVDLRAWDAKGVVQTKG
jgi:hypothetical protein